MRCVSCTAEFPFDLRTEADFRCLFCDGEVFPTPVDFLSQPVLGLAQEVRQTQLDLTQLINDTIRDGGVGVFEAGTGVGKSFAYILPSILTSPGRVLISTAKKTLQEQLINKDLPLIRKVLLANGGEDFKFAVAYGKGNYICRKALKSNKQDKATWDTFFDSAKHEWTWDSLNAYTKTFSIKRGNKTLLNVLRYDGFATADKCVGPSCNYASDGTCTYMSARRAVAEASVVVTNHWLFGFHVRLVQEQERPLLGYFDTVIVDEAHKLDDGIRAAHTDGISQERLQSVVHTYEELVLKSTEWVPAKALLDANAALFAEVSGPKSTGANAPSDGRVHVANNIGTLLTHISALTTQLLDSTYAGVALNVSNGAEVASYITTLRDSIDTSPPVASSTKLPEWVSSSRAAAYRHTYNDLRDMEDILQRVIAPPPGETTVTYMGENRGAPSIVTAPVETGPILQRWLQRDSKAISAAIGPVRTSVLGGVSGTWGAGALSPRAIVFLSATLAVGGSLDVFARRAGVAYHPKLSTGTFGSAFDLAQQATLYVASKIPVPTRGAEIETYRAAISDEIHAMITANAGNAFVLFTARDEMLDVYARVNARTSLPILLQDGASSAADILDRYRKTSDAVLFGLKSFWEGIDVAGDKLSLVIITKLPFPGRSDAVVNARREIAGDAWFGLVDVPDMIFDLRQGLGRLIRTVTDTGVAAILDSRVLTKPYGKTVLRSTGFTRAHTRIEQVLPVLEAQSRARKA